MSLTDLLTPALEQRISRLLGLTVLELRPMPGGHSGITLVCTTTGDHRVVVKMAAPGRPAIGRHDVLRQVRAMTAAAPYVPVPEILAVDDGDDDPAAGVPPLAIVSFASGVASEPVIDETGVDLPEDLVSVRFDRAVEVLADLHRVPAESLGDEPATTPAAELAQFRRIGAAGEPEFVDAAERAAEALGKETPDPWRVGLVHGDFRLGNVLFEGTTARAVVDWEIWTVGDPRVDLGWMATFADAAHFPGITRDDVVVPGCASVQEAYARAVGSDVPDADWFLRLGAFRMGAIMAHNLKRHRTGRHVDPFQERLPATIARLYEVAAG